MVTTSPKWSTFAPSSMLFVLKPHRFIALQLAQLMTDCFISSELGTMQHHITVTEID
jgi:hypothetical protein